MSERASGTGIDAETGRSQLFFSEPHVAGFTHRAFTKAMGYDDEQAKQAIRISLGRQVNIEDIDDFLTCLEAIITSFRQTKVL